MGQTNNTNKTLVILSPAFPADESETFWVPSQQLLVKSLKENFPGLNIIVIAYFYPYKKAIYEWHGIKIISLNGMKTARPSLFIKIWRTLKELKKENIITEMVSFWCREGAFVANWFSRQYRLKHVCWICGQDARKTNKVVKWVRPAANQLIAISDFISDEFYKNHGVRPAQIIPNAIVPSLFSGEPPEKRDIDLLGVGSLVPLKQFEIFVSVVKKITADVPGIKAVICGSGSESEKLKSLISELNLANNIRLLESVPHGEVLTLMQRSKILLHPSSFEGFSTVCLEAIYAGANVVSFTRAMNHDIKNWHIVKTEEEMKTKTLSLLQNQQLNHDRVLIYDMKDSAKQFMSLFD
jgi:glycosyltransferase involved in cell wall biosynthesis